MTRSNVSKMIEKAGELAELPPFRPATLIRLDIPVGTCWRMQDTIPAGYSSGLGIRILNIPRDILS